MTTSTDFDDSIPVLTEVFQEAPAPAPAPAPQATLPPGEPDWSALERRVAERVLHQLQGRVDFVLEQRLRDSMNEIVRAALGPLTADIRQGLQETLAQTVARAVAAEIAHLQAQKG